MDKENKTLELLRITEKARYFWMVLRRQVMLEELAQHVPDEQIEEFRDFCNEFYLAPQDKGENSLEGIALVYVVGARAGDALDMEKIQQLKDALGELVTIPNDETLVVTILGLGLLPFDYMLNSVNDPVMKEMRNVEGSVRQAHNNRIKTLAPLLATLKSLQSSESPLIEKNASLAPLIEKAEWEIQISKEIIQLGNEAHKDFLRRYHIDDNIDKAPQKHHHWNAVVSNLIKIFNDSYCTDDCKRKCTIIHEKTILKVAELLKILYPSIWTEDIPAIARRIKQKDYRTRYQPVTFRSSPVTIK